MPSILTKMPNIIKCGALSGIICGAILYV